MNQTNWEKSGNISGITEGDNLLIVFGTNLLADNWPIHEIITFEELEFSERLKGLGQKSTWLSCRASLRWILSSYLKIMPQNIKFRKGKFGKPTVADTNINFNVSHTSHSFLMCFNTVGRIGIDIEKLSGLEDLAGVMEYAFSPDEAIYCSNGNLNERFNEVWTMKEAFLKATGVGLIDKLTSISVIGKNAEIKRFNLNQKTFLCPDGETGTVVYQNSQPLKFIWLT